MGKLIGIELKFDEQVKVLSRIALGTFQCAYLES